MFSRIKDALDRTLAEEQARYKAPAERTANAKKSDQPGPTNADPAVFEAAFKLEDEPDSSRSSRSSITLKPDDTNLNADEPNSDKNGSARGHNGDTDKSASADASEGPSDSTAALPAPLDLPPHIKVKLKKLERVAHSRATATERFERALRENTPLSTVKDPDAFVEYINQLNLKNDMVVEELKSVSTDKDGFKRKLEDAEKELAASKDEIATLKAAKVNETAGQMDEAGDGKVQEKEDEGGDMFSYDDEIPKLQAELASKDGQIEKLTSKYETVKEALAKAQESLVKLMEEREDRRKPNDLKNNEDVEASAAKEELITLLAEKETQVKKLEASAKETNASIEELRKENNRMLEKITILKEEGETQRKANAESKKRLEEWAKEVQSVSNASNEPSSASTATPATTGPAKRKNKKNKKKKGGASQIHRDIAPSETLEHSESSTLESPEIEALTTEISQLKEEIAEKDSQISKLSEKRKTEEDLREEVANLREDLVIFGQANVEAKENIKEYLNSIATLEREKSALQNRQSELEKEIEHAKSNPQLQTEYDTMKKEFDEFKVRQHTLESELGASLKTAQDRFKDLAQHKELLAKAQNQIRSLGQELAASKITREEYTSKVNELRTAEKRAKELGYEVNRLERLSSDRDSEIKLLSDRLAAEKTSRAKLEDEKRTLGRDYRRSEAEKTEIVAKGEKTGSELKALQSELASLRPKIKELDGEVTKLRKENAVAKEDVDLKTQQYNKAQGLLTSMRDQVTELSVQRKEAQNQAESLEEELAEVQKHLGERTREAETMRRMLADVDEKADAKVREAKSRMEAAIEERDRVEDESSTLARRRAREAEDLKNRVRELEREVKTLSNDKDELEVREREWRRRREELEQVEEKATAETEDMRSTVSSLRSALDASEQQVRDTEKQKTDLRKLLDEARGRYERANKELKGVQSRLNLGSGSNVTSSGRSSMDSTRSGFSGSPAKGQDRPLDITYFKNVFLQFLEVKDEKLRSQLMPAIGNLLQFDKDERQRGLRAIQHLQK
ncbi:hypothetical protein EKO27_g3630 [Xylaria grammica]|uniref:GRIP domain-containing protein n=1 Tax=Xylaria grammica TaxID=363999 RepID=A0A439DAM6_9PEZI|nr:hypothetical protein EKO27_g3630 [Xylaria grammica]